MSKYRDLLRSHFRSAKIVPAQRYLGRVLLFSFILFATVVVAEPSTDADTKPATIQALQEYNVLIGGWRGVGMPKRGSQTGAWQERADLVWELKPKSKGIRLSVDTGKQLKSALLSYDETQKQFTLNVTLPDDSSRSYRGKIEEKRLVLQSDADPKNEVHRATISILNENRFTLLLEKRPEQQSFYSRVAEIGYQRDGTRLAATTSSGPECVVTGGLGTIMVSYKGKTYYVCCTGCREAFNDDPEGILADYQKRKAEEKAKK